MTDETQQLQLLGDDLAALDGTANLRSHPGGRDAHGKQSQTTLLHGRLRGIASGKWKPSPVFYCTTRSSGPTNGCCCLSKYLIKPLTGHHTMHALLCTISPYCW
jgi:hypothetical protein